MVFSKRFIHGVLILGLLLSGLSASGQFFSPNVPEEDPKWDWIKLDTGEYVKGELRVMYEEELEFDSDHFGVITIDWDDIEEIRTARSQTIRTNMRTSLVGKLVMEENVVKVISEDGEQVLRRGQVLSIAAGQPRESNYWSFKGSVGGNVRTGNVDQVDYSARVTIQRRTALTRLYWDYTGSYSTSGEIVTANSHRTNGYFDYFFSKRFFIRPISAEFNRDPIINIDTKQVYSASLGYTIVDRDKLTIDVTGGPSWQRVQYVNVSEGEQAIRNSQGGVFTATVDWEITSYIDFIGKYQAQWASNDAGGISSLADSTFEIEITKNIDLNLSFILEGIQNPISDEAGEIPQKYDFKVIFGLGFDL